MVAVQKQSHPLFWMIVRCLVADSPRRRCNGIWSLFEHQHGTRLRLGGSGGFFGWFGRFWSRRLGHHRMYATNGRDLVYIERVDGTKVVLSPFPADAFVAAVEEAKG